MRPDTDPDACPLCHWQAPTLYFEDRRRRYLRCGRCGLVFVPQRFWLAPAEEKAVYDLHQNDPADAGYRRFLSRLSEPLLERLSPRRRGLDFGCGPGPALHLLLEAHGHRVDLYDPHYFPDGSVLERSYDFITATEVVEHLREPARVLADLFALLRPDGWLALMTKRVRSREAFRNWHYIRDPTHICFFSDESLAFVSQRFNSTLEVVGDDVVFFQNGAAPTAT